LVKIKNYKKHTIIASNRHINVSGNYTKPASVNIYANGNILLDCSNSTIVNNTTGSTGTSSGALQVKGGAGIGGNAYIGGIINTSNSTASTTTSSGALQVAGGAGIGGNVNIGGTVTATGTITANSFNATSDYRIKTNVQPLTSTNYTIDPLNPVFYTNKLSQKEDIGLIAHEVQEHFPFLVNGLKDGDTTQSVNYTGFIGLLIYEIQKLKERNNEQTVKLDEQTVKLDEQTVKLDEQTTEIATLKQQIIEILNRLNAK
jgi:hypothetical protein